MLFKCETCGLEKELTVNYFEDEKMCPKCKTLSLFRPDLAETRNKINEAFRSKARLGKV